MWISSVFCFVKIYLSAPKIWTKLLVNRQATGSQARQVKGELGDMGLDFDTPPNDKKKTLLLAFLFFFVEAISPPTQLHDASPRRHS